MPTDPRKMWNWDLKVCQIALTNNELNKLPKSFWMCHKKIIRNIRKLVYIYIYIYIYTTNFKQEKLLCQGLFFQEFASWSPAYNCKETLDQISAFLWILHNFFNHVLQKFSCKCKMLLLLFSLSFIFFYVESKTMRKL